MPSSPTLSPAVRYAVAANVVASFLVATAKLTVFAMTSSAGMFADAAESIVHCAASLFAAFSVWYAARPADQTHPYGHGRIVYLAVGVEGVLVLVASASAIGAAAALLWNNVAVRNVNTGLLLGSLIALFNLGLAFMLLRVGRRHQSLVLIANSRHILADVLTTAAAVSGIGLVHATGIPWIDPAAGVLIGILILASGLSLIRQSLAGILDRLDPALAAQLREHLCAARDRGEIQGFHQLRCRALDRELWVEVHLVMDGSISVDDAHDRVTLLETQIAEELKDYVVRFASHIEPPGHKRAHPVGHEPPVDPLVDSTGHDALS